MQNAETVLSILKQKSEHDENYKFNRLYRNLFNEDFYLQAYQTIYAKEGNMTKGVDQNTIDGFNRKQIKQLIDHLKSECYQPLPVKRVYIPKKNNKKKRPLGIPVFSDKLIQEVIRELLEVIYEPLFCNTSHGYRPNRSCHTALYQTKQTFIGANWIIEGDITGFFDNVDHEILLKLLAKKICDGRLLELIRRFLKAGYFEFKQVHNSLSGTPQGSNLSPILANIYLHHFDKYMETLTKKYTKGTKKRPYPPYAKLVNKRRKAKKQSKHEKAKKLLRQMQTIHAVDPMDENFIRVQYVRVADDFLVGVIGSKALCLELKREMTNFLKHELGLELNSQKTSLTNLSKGRLRFVGYEITKMHCNSKRAKNTNGYSGRSINGRIALLVPNQAIRDKLKSFIDKKGHAGAVVTRKDYPVLDIINMYNAEIRGLYNYYCLAQNVSTRLSRFKYYHYGSLLKTLACREQTSAKKIRRKYAVTVPKKSGVGTIRIVGIQYRTKASLKSMTYFNERLVRVDRPLTHFVEVFWRPFSGGQLLKRFNADQCELCGATIGDMEVHHIRKLKDVKDRYRKHGKTPPVWVVVMAKIKRKTLIVCRDCHVAIHNGTF